MRNRQLHDALRAFALEAAALLREDQDAGAEVEFDLDETARRGGPALYHYRPLSAKFVADRWPRLRRLPASHAATAALGAGAAAYLRANGLRGSDAEPALQAMLERIYEDATDFSFPEERFERVYVDVERTLYEHSQPATVLAAVHGLELEADRIELGGGLALLRGTRADAPDEALWGGPERSAADAGDGPRDPNALVALTRDVRPGDPAPLAEAAARFRALVTGLRLWKPGGVALAGVGWRRSGEGAWQPFELGGSGMPHGAPWVLAEEEAEGLVRFLEAVGHGRAGGSVAWALSRFEMGCGRREAEALSDHLLGLRALLQARDDGSGADLALRVAVLCAEEGARRSVQRRLELAQALERLVMGDAPDDDYLDAIGPDSARSLVEEVERHLRALLRDVLCGYLDPNLRTLSDDLLLEQQVTAPDRAPQPVAERPPEPAPEPVAEADRAQAGFTDQIEALESAGGEYGVTAAREPQPAHDWDDDPSGYSAPV